MEQVERNESVPEENTQEIGVRKGLTNDNKVSILLLSVAVILWIFAPFIKGDYYRTTALEFLAGPIFPSWKVYAEAFFGKMSHSEYVEMMSASREFWVAIAVGVFLLLGIVASLRNNRRLVVIFCVLGFIACFAPMLEIVFYVIKTGEGITEDLLRGFFSAFAWGYWIMPAVFVAVGIINRAKEQK